MLYTGRVTLVKSEPIQRFSGFFNKWIFNVLWYLN
jgi:hypothetical protein